MAQEQVEVEFRGEMQQLMAIRQNPQAAMNPQIQMQAKMTGRKNRSKKSSTNCWHDGRIYEGREENYVSIW